MIPIVPGNESFRPVDQDKFLYLTTFANAVASGKMPYSGSRFKTVEEMTVSAVTDELAEIGKEMSAEERAGYCLRLIALPKAISVIGSNVGNDFRKPDGTSNVPMALLRAVAVSRFKDMEQLDEEDLQSNYERGIADGGTRVGLGRVLSTTICNF